MDGFIFPLFDWVQFSCHFKNDECEVALPGMIAQIISRAIRFKKDGPSELVYTVRVPSSLGREADDWATFDIHDVPEKILKEYELPSDISLAVTFSRISNWNAKLQKHEAGKEISDMDERFMQLFKMSEEARFAWKEAGYVYKPCPTPMRICYDGLTTVVFWEDGTVTSVRCSEEDKDKFSEYSGFTAALAKKMYGTHGDIVRLIEKKRAKPGRPITPPEKWKKMQAHKKEG